MVLIQFLKQYWWITDKQVSEKQKITRKISGSYNYEHAATKLTFPWDTMKDSNISIENAFQTYEQYHC